ncbi:MAG: GNAT family N-acetyltransferase [Prevotellaceae bacterium]|jgi:ribosomal protein S18 acetylase RimI-like enzyme|nr:GNAT family N-acetyltransferase [Prevotellaceae bacterium]
MENKMIEYGMMLENEILLLLDLYKQLNPDNILPDEFTVKNVWNEIEKQSVKYFVARDKDKIVAACYICIIPNLTYGGKSIGYIENVVTDKNYRRKGIGKKIIENAVNHAKANNCYKVVLQSGNSRMEAHKFYESIGFDGDAKKAFEIRL